MSIVVKEFPTSPLLRAIAAQTKIKGSQPAVAPTLEYTPLSLESFHGTHTEDSGKSLVDQRQEGPVDL
ncbi:hypothetical protein EMIT0194P_70305 [Pseudomonas serbica]